MRLRRPVLGVLLSVHATLSTTAVLASPLPGNPRPNIILLLADDLDANPRWAEFMPHLKRELIEQGTTFANAFVTTSLCCPSRTSLLRGQYTHNHQIRTNNPPRGGFQKYYALGYEESNVATWLKSAGYTTAFIGKYLNGYPEDVGPTHVPSGWDEWASPAGGKPYTGYDYTLNENGRLVVYRSRSEDYLTDVLAGKATSFLARTAGDSRPFFMILAPYAPHSPATPARRHEGAFRNAVIPRPPSFNELDVSDKPEWVRWEGLLDSEAIADIDRLYRSRMQSMAAVDEMVGRLFEQLSALGKLENTYFFFTSDNGFHLGQHRLLPGKMTPYDEDVHVPLVVRGPEVPKATVLDPLVGNIDLAPTFLSLAGARVPDIVDGRSLMPLLGGAPRWRQALLLEGVSLRLQASREPGSLLFMTRHLRKHSSTPGGPSRFDEGLLEPSDPMELERMDSRGSIPEYKAIRTRDYKFVRYETGELELYDLRSDPYELESLHQKASAAVLAQLSALLQELSNCASANCRTAEDASERRLIQAPPR